MSSTPPLPLLTHYMLSSNDNIYICKRHLCLFYAILFQKYLIIYQHTPSPKVAQDIFNCPTLFFGFLSWKYQLNGILTIFGIIYLAYFDFLLKRQILFKS